MHQPLIAGVVSVEENVVGLPFSYRPFLRLWYCSFGKGLGSITPPDGFPVVLGLFKQCEGRESSREKFSFCMVKTVVFCLYDYVLKVVHVLAPFHSGPGQFGLELQTSVGADGLAHQVESVQSRSVSGVLPT